MWSDDTWILFGVRAFSCTLCLVSCLFCVALVSIEIAAQKQYCRDKRNGNSCRHHGNGHVNTTSITISSKMDCCPSTNANTATNTITPVSLSSPNYKNTLPRLEMNKLNQSIQLDLDDTYNINDRLSPENENKDRNNNIRVPKIEKNIYNLSSNNIIMLINNVNKYALQEEKKVQLEKKLGSISHNTNSNSNSNSNVEDEDCVAKYKRSKLSQIKDYLYLSQLKFRLCQLYLLCSLLLIGDILWQLMAMIISENEELVVSFIDSKNFGVILIKLVFNGLLYNISCCLTQILSCIMYLIILKTFSLQSATIAEMNIKSRCVNSISDSIDTSIIRASKRKYIQIDFEKNNDSYKRLVHLIYFCISIGIITSIIGIVLTVLYNLFEVTKYTTSRSYIDIYLYFVGINCDYSNLSFYFNSSLEIYRSMLLLICVLHIFINSWLIIWFIKIIKLIFDKHKEIFLKNNNFQSRFVMLVLLLSLLFVEKVFRLIGLSLIIFIFIPKKNELSYVMFAQTIDLISICLSITLNSLIIVYLQQFKHTLYKITCQKIHDICSFII